MIINAYERWLPAKEYLNHLRKHSSSIHELVDEECLAALDNVEAQYGELRSSRAGLEVRLGSQQRNVDYILCTTDGSPFPGSAIWFEMDYQAFCEPGEVSPCLFLNTWAASDEEYPVAWWDQALEFVAGVGRTSRLRQGLLDVIERLPQGVCVKQIGAMARPGEENSLRIVLMFLDWEQVPETMQTICWPGDTKALATTLAAYADMEWMGVNLDLDERGIRQKTSVELGPRWRHPRLVDRMVYRLERSGLCLPQKGDALRRWVRIPPDADPFIQTTISHYKLGFENGKVSEAKAYLQLTPYPLHRLYPKD